MALIKCPECGKEISDRAEACPNCAYPITKINENDTVVCKEAPNTEAEYRKDNPTEVDNSKSLEEELRIREEQRRKRREAARIKKQRARRRKIIIISSITVVLIVGVAVLFGSRFLNQEPISANNDTSLLNSTKISAEQVYSDLANYVSQNGEAYTSNSDINNPNKVEYYYLLKEKELGDYSCDESLVILPVDEGNPTIIFELFKHNYENFSDDYSEAFPGKEYINQDTEVTLGYNLNTGKIDAIWKETLYTSDSESFGYEYHSTGGYGEVIGIDAAEYSHDMEFPEITSFSSESWARIDNSTIRAEILTMLKIAINDMVLMLQECGFSPEQLGFTNFVPASNMVISPEELLKQVLNEIIEKYPQYIGDSWHNNGSQLIITTSEDSGFDYNIYTSSDEALIKKWNDFKNDCLTIFFSNSPNTLFLRGVNVDWNIMFKDASGELIDQYSTSGYSSYITKWDLNTKSWEKADFSLDVDNYKLYY